MTDERWKSGWLDGALLAVMLLGSGLVRLYGATTRSLWFDESISWRFLTFPFLEMMERIAQDAHPPLYYLVLRLWTAVFGESLLALRGLSVVFADLAIVGVYFLALEAFAPREGDAPRRGRARFIGLAAAALMAASPFHIRLSGEVRMYTLGTALVVWSSWLMLRALHRPGRARGWWAGYGVSALLLAYTHYMACLSIAGQAVFLAGQLLGRHRLDFPALIRDPLFRGAGLAFSIVLLGLLPWLPVFVAQQQQIHQYWWSGPLEARKLICLFYWLTFWPRGPCQAGTVGWPTLLVYLGLMIFLILRGRRGDRLLVAMVVVPFGGALLYSLLGRSLMVWRFFALVQIFLFMSIPAAISWIPVGWLRILVVGGLLAGLIPIDVQQAVRRAHRHRPGIIGAAAYLDARRRPGEPVVVCTPLRYLPFLYHAGDRRDWYVYREKPGSFLHHGGGPVLTDQEIMLKEDLASISAGRAWMVTTHGRWGARRIPVPETWTALGSKTFPDGHSFHRDQVISLYRTGRGSSP